MSEDIGGFWTSASTAKLDAALAVVQSKLKGAGKDKVNPAFPKSRYADLEAVWEACRGELTTAGISVTQWPLHSTDGRLHLLTRLALAGEWMAGRSSMPVTKADAHGTGSATTYAKRQALCAAVGVVPVDEVDDDGNAASDVHPMSVAPTRLPTPAPMKANAPVPQRADPPTRGMTFPNFGRQKGQAIYGADMEALQFYAAAALRSLNDPAKERFHDKERTLLAALNAEMQRQGAGIEVENDVSF
jgi:hypothetical protein